MPTIINGQCPNCGARAETRAWQGQIIRFCLAACGWSETPMTDSDLMLWGLAATFDCERQSETWYDCPTVSAEDRHYRDITWCRSCTAKALLGDGQPKSQQLQLIEAAERLGS